MQPSNTLMIIINLRKYGTVCGKFSRGPVFVIFIKNQLTTKIKAAVFDYNIINA